MAAPGYRWVVLGVGTAAQACVSAAMFSVAVLAPELRAEFQLTIAETGIVLAAFTIGMTPTLLPWGLLADRIGERIVLPVGLGTSALALAGVGLARGYGELVVLLAAAGALSASVNAASGRAVMQWFDPSERGLALGIRQANVPLGGLVAALALPATRRRRRPRLDVRCAGGCVWRRCDRRGHTAAQPRARRQRTTTAPLDLTAPLRNRPIWLVSSGSALIIVGQTATMSFTVLFLHEGRGFTTGSAALVLAASQVLGGAFGSSRATGPISSAPGSCRSADSPSPSPPVSWSSERSRGRLRGPSCRC